MLATTVKLHDIDDVEGFVADCIQRAGLTLTAGEREDLTAEGITLLYELAARYEPHRAGYKQPGRFSGYASVMLPRQLGDAWHAANRHHSRVRCPDGKRRWVYQDPPISFESHVAENPDRTRGAGGHGNGESSIRPWWQWAPVAVPAASTLSPNS